MLRIVFNFPEKSGIGALLIISSSKISTGLRFKLDCKILKICATVAPNSVLVSSLYFISYCKITICFCFIKTSFKLNPSSLDETESRIVSVFKNLNAFESAFKTDANKFLFSELCDTSLSIFLLSDLQSVINLLKVLEYHQIRESNRARLAKRDKALFFHSQQDTEQNIFAPSLKTIESLFSGGIKILIISSRSATLSASEKIL